MPGMSEYESGTEPEAAAPRAEDAAALAAETNTPTALPPQKLAPTVEAVLLTCERALPTPKIAELIPGCKNKDITAAIAALNALYEQTGRSFRIEELAGGWQIMTLPQFAPVLGLLHKSRTQTKLTPAALETLAIVAYKQPILRAEIETIRGVASGEMLRSLMERRLVKIVGRAEVMGRPMLYGTTKVFLEMYGLASLKDLPKVEDLKQPA